MTTRHSEVWFRFRAPLQWHIKIQEDFWKYVNFKDGVGAVAASAQVAGRKVEKEHSSVANVMTAARHGMPQELPQRSRRQSTI